MVKNRSWEWGPSFHKEYEKHGWIFLLRFWKLVLRTICTAKVKQTKSRDSNVYLMLKWSEDENTLDKKHAPAMNIWPQQFSMWVCPHNTKYCRCPRATPFLAECPWPVSSDAGSDKSLPTRPVFSLPALRCRHKRCNGIWSNQFKGCISVPVIARKKPFLLYEGLNINIVQIRFNWHWAKSLQPNKERKWMTSNLWTLERKSHHLQQVPTDIS